MNTPPPTPPAITQKKQSTEQLFSFQKNGVNLIGQKNDMVGTVTIDESAFPTPCRIIEITVNDLTIKVPCLAGGIITIRKKN